MASTASAPVEQTKVKPSFAKVAASALKPQTHKESPSSNKTPTPNMQSATHSQTSIPPPAGDTTVQMLRGNSVDRGNKDKARDTGTTSGQWTNATGQQVAFEEGAKEELPDKPRAPVTLVKSLATDDSTTQLSSSDGSAKPASLDGKSVASATTFALDEKESLRPDDSASLRAVEEEDITSPPDSVANGSRVGSDSGARAFRDQLHEIAVMGPLPQRGAPPGRFQNPNVISHPVLYDPNQPPPGVTRSISQPVVSGMTNVGTVPPVPAVPDEKLIEALESPRDRLFVLKLEQDFIDFVKDSSENELSLPNCNTFYRMLAHRLADYYLLGHVVDNTLTGVKITKTAFCRIPPPLSGLPVSSKTTSTPPVDLPARKIMRRGGDGKSGTNTTANSEGPSKTASEAGAASGSDGGNEGGNDAESKDKSSLTREEREARYREARQRIFGASEGEENGSGDGAGQSEERDISRSSSAAGKKKTKKQRNYDDDGFEARSRFNLYYPQQYPTAAYGGDGGTLYYGAYPGAMQTPQYPSMGANVSPPPTYNNGYGMMSPQDMQTQYGWAGQTYPSPNAQTAYPNYPGPTSNGYDLSADFNRGMQSFQSAGMAGQLTPKMTSPPLATYQDTYQAQTMPMGQGWSQMSGQPAYSVGQAPYVQSSPMNRPMNGMGQGPSPVPYAYGQFPTPGFNNGKQTRNQHPIPGSFNRQQFNPQSQSFIPGGRNGPFPMQPNMTQMHTQPMNMNGYGAYQMQMANQMPNPMGNQMARPSPPANHPQAFGSPRLSHNANLTPPKVNNQAHHYQLPQPTSTQGPLAQQPGSGQSNSSIPAQSSIAKWGTPSHLPPKPPPPAQSQPPKFPLTGHNFPPVARPPVNIPPPFTPNITAIRGGGGGDHPNVRPS